MSTFDLTCSTCRPLFTPGPARPDCEHCHGTGSYSVTYHDVKYRIVTTATYEIETAADLDNYDGIRDMLEHTDTWADPPPTNPVDGDISHLEIEVDGEWQPLTRNYVRNTDGDWVWKWSLGDSHGEDADRIVAEAFRANTETKEATGASADV